MILNNIICLSRKKSHSLINIMFCVASVLCLYRFVAIAALHAYGFIFFGFVFFLIAANYYSYKIRFTFFILFPFVLFISFISFLFSGDASEEGILYYTTVFMFPFIYYFVTILLLTPIDTEIIIYNIKVLLKWYLFYLLIETLVRYISVLQALSNENYIAAFYKFKFNSISYTDTNFLALHILNIICLIIYLKNYTKEKKWNKFLIILSLFAILALSRSVIITVAILFYFRHFNNLMRKKQYCISIIELILSVSTILFLYFYFVSNDSSFKSKIETFQGMSLMKHYPLNNVLFGFGFEKGGYIYSYTRGGYGHTHYALLMGHYGILGTFLFVVFFIFMLVQTKWQSFYLIMTFIITGFSLMWLDSSFFWVLGVISVLSKRKREMK